MTPTEQPHDKPQKGSFVLFKNEKKEGDHPRKPVYGGSIELPDGTKFDLAGWVNDGKPGSKMEGKKYIKGEVSLPWVPPVRDESPKPAEPKSVHGDDNIPW
jgi:hypothetical protein